jgi:pimeloyl-ACP methyl ester carboxylesterase
MTVVTEPQTDATAILPFTFEAAEADLEELRARIAATRWPENEPVHDQSQGVQLATIQLLAPYPNLIHYNELDKGGHFAAWEQPQLFSGEIRAAFTSLRNRESS